MSGHRIDSEVIRDIGGIGDIGGIEGGTGRMVVGGPWAAPAGADPDEAGADPDFPEGENVVRLRGEITGEPEVRLLPSGTVMMSFSVRVPGRAGRRTSLPVTIWDPDAGEESLASGDRVRVHGALLRRFWAAGDGSRRSRVEIVANSSVRC